MDCLTPQDAAVLAKPLDFMEEMVLDTYRDNPRWALRRCATHGLYAHHKQHGVSHCPYTSCTVHTAPYQY